MLLDAATNMLCGTVRSNPYECRDSVARMRHGGGRKVSALDNSASNGQKRTDRRAQCGTSSPLWGRRHILKERRRHPCLGICHSIILSVLVFTRTRTQLVHKNHPAVSEHSRWSGPCSFRKSVGIIITQIAAKQMHV